MQNLRSFLSQLFLIKTEKISERHLSGNQNFSVWKEVCEEILAKPFPPQGSDFSAEEMEAGNRGSFSKLSNWEIICEEIVDTEYSPVYYQRCYDELRKRGKSEQEIFEMRSFAWQTAGWLNFPMMAWDWVSLDELDILRAIEKLYDHKQINQEQRIEFQNFLKQHES